MKGFKVFNSDWTCRGFQFEVGKTFTEDVTPVCCDRGFHFCTKAADCFKYYDFNPDNKVAEVEALGDIDTNNDDSKCSTNKIHIIREITWQEVLDLVNLGTAVIATAVIGTAVIGTAVIGTAVIGTAVIGTAVIGTAVIGTAVIATAVIGTAVIGTAVIATAVIGTAVIGTAVIGTAVIGTRLAFQMVVSIQNHQRFSCSTNFLIGHIRIG